MAQNNLLPRKFGKITLTLENCLLSENKLQETPSQQDGLDKETEIDLRILGCELIQISGILLKLPQVAMATGQVLFQRFYYSISYLRLNMETTAMACIYLASKIEEAPRRIRDVINVFHHIKQVRGQKPIHPMILNSSYISLKEQVIKAERRVLKELGFCVHIKHPHKLIVLYLQVLGCEKNQTLMQTAWNFMNDSLRTDVFVRYNPESIACACIYLTARKINLPLPNNPTWYGVFNVSENDILDISYKIMDLYRRAKPNAEALEQKVDKVRKVFEEKRNKNKTGQNTPSITTISVDRNDKSHNAWGGFISRAPANNENKPDSEKPPVRTDSQSTVRPVNTDTVPPVNQAVHHNDSSTNENTKTTTRLSRDQQSGRRSPSRSSRSKSNSRSPSDKRKKMRNRSRSRSRTTEKHKGKKSRDNGDGQRVDKKHHSSDKHREYRDRERRDRDRSRENRYSKQEYRDRERRDRFRDRKR